MNLNRLRKELDTAAQVASEEGLSFPQNMPTASPVAQPEWEGPHPDKIIHVRTKILEGDRESSSLSGSSYNAVGHHTKK